MLDLIEGARVIVGNTPTSAVVAGGDWINTENMHTVWAICLRSVGKTYAQVFEGQVSESYAGASASTAQCKIWYSNTVSSTSLNTERLIASTNTTGWTAGTSDCMCIMRFDPASADTSDHFFRVATPTSGWLTSIAYVCEPRYASLNPGLATTSST